MKNEVIQLIALVILFVLPGSLLFELNNNYSFKRISYPVWNILFGAAVIGWMIKYMNGWQVYVIGFPTIALAVAWSIWTTRFCPYCGKTNYCDTSFKPPVECRRCGKSFK